MFNIHYVNSTSLVISSFLSVAMGTNFNLQESLRVYFGAYEFGVRQRIQQGDQERLQREVPFHLGPEGWRGSGHMGMGAKTSERRGRHGQKNPCCCLLHRLLSKKQDAVVRTCPQGVKSPGSMNASLPWADHLWVS